MHTLTWRAWAYLPMLVSDSCTAVHGQLRDVVQAHLVNLGLHVQPRVRKTRAPGDLQRCGHWVGQRREPGVFDDAARRNHLVQRGARVLQALTSGPLVPMRVWGAPDPAGGGEQGASSSCSSRAGGRVRPSRTCCGWLARDAVRARARALRRSRSLSRAFVRGRWPCRGAWVWRR